MTDRLDLLIVNPVAAHGIYGALGDELVAVEPPLWLRLIGGYVRDRGFSVRLVDAEATKEQPDEVAALVAELKPRLTAIVVFGHQPSASTQQMFGARQVARLQRRGASDDPGADSGPQGLEYPGPCLARPGRGACGQQPGRTPDRGP